MSTCTCHSSVESPEYIPKLHKFDEDCIITKVVENIVCIEDAPLRKCAYVDVVLVRSAIPKSGFGADYPCDMANLSVAELLPFPSIALLRTVISKGYTVTLKDIEKAVLMFTKDHMDHVKILTDNFVRRDPSFSFEQQISDVCSRLVKEKLYFVPLLIKLGAKPNPIDIAKDNKFHRLDPITAEYVAKGCNAYYRTLALKESLAESAKFHASLIVGMDDEDNGIIVEDFDLTDYITTSIFLKKPELVENLIKAGVSPLGHRNDPTPLSHLCSSKEVTHSQLARLGEILISHGASIQDLKITFEDRMTPAHIATKLALETGLYMYTCT